MITLTSKQILKLFVHRKDVFSKQQKTGVYWPEKKPLTEEIIQQHLNGEISVGVYCLNTDNTVKWACIDLDIKKHCIYCNSDTTAIDYINNEWVCISCNKREKDNYIGEFYKRSKRIYNLFYDFPRMREFSGRKCDSTRQVFFGPMNHPPFPPDVLWTCGAPVQQGL